MARVSVDLKVGDVIAEPGDVLVLKYAQRPHGLDSVVADILGDAGVSVDYPHPWQTCCLNAKWPIAASKLLFVGVPPLHDFGYRQIRAFARKAVAALAENAPRTEHLLFTVHGCGYGLDEIEAFEAELAGLIDAVREDDCPEALKRITIVERNIGRARRLSSSLTELLPDHVIEKANASSVPHNVRASEKLRAAGYLSDAKGHVFVAMPFKDEMEDVYHYGIQSAVRASGLLCERADLSAFTGDVMAWVQSRIRSASLMVADLTDANPNVYLEVGYAWGAGIPTVLLVHSTDHLKFDVRGQRCLVYKKIKELEEALTKELKSLGIPV